MQPADLSLDAALRDVHASSEAARGRAIRNVAPALLEAQGLQGPAWEAAADHPRGNEALEALRKVVRSGPPPEAGIAAVGLGLLGDVDVLPVATEWLERQEESEDASFLRECAILATGYVGAAAPSDDPRRSQIEAQLLARIDDQRPDVRFQAVVAFAEVADARAQTPLRAALRREVHPEVVEHLVVALSMLEPLDEGSLEALIDHLDEEHATSTSRYEAALVLAGAGRLESLGVLREHLHHRLDRDRALEALAVLGPAVGAEARNDIAGLAQRWWLPGVTRVRAAYAWIRCSDPNDARAVRLLERLRWHPRPAVREAVRDAQDLLRDGG